MIRLTIEHFINKHLPAHGLRTAHTEYGNLIVDSGDTGVGRPLLVGEKYEKESTYLMDEMLKPDWVCVDVGANIGFMTRVMARKAGFVHAFEPEPKNFLLLSRNTAKIPNVKLYHMALSDANTSTMFYNSDDDNGGRHSLSEKNARGWGYHVAACRLDYVINNKVDFIKMDVEGAEMKVLRGAAGLIEKYHPALLLEFCPDAIRNMGESPEAEIEFLRMHGYNVKPLYRDIVNLRYMDHTDILCT